jgi:alginate O-acetyltransferase complex protein AlgJ
VRSRPSSVKPRRGPRRTGQVILVIAFLVVLYLPAVGMIAQPHRRQTGGSWQQSEHRAFPRITGWSSILSFPRGFAEYFAVNFGFRKNLIRWHTTIVGKVFGKTTSSKVLQGKNGWLFYGDSKTIEDYRGMLPFTPAQLQRWQEVLETQRDWLSARGIRYLFVVCPDKHSIYPEYMPDNVDRVQARTRLDQLVQHMKEYSTVEVLDLRPTLLELKKSRLCYQPQETHWNGIGAFAAYQEIARRLRAWYPEFQVLEMADCETFWRENPQTDMLRLQGRQDVATRFEDVRPINGFVAECRVDPNDPGGDIQRRMHSTCRRAPLGRLLMFHDSFGVPLTCFLAEHVRDGLYLWVKNDRFLAPEVLDYRPEVVIQEILERKLCEVKPDLLEAPAPPAEGQKAPSLREAGPE